MVEKYIPVTKNSRYKDVIQNVQNIQISIYTKSRWMKIWRGNDIKNWISEIKQQNNPEIDELFT